MAGEPLITVIGNLVADPEPRVSQAGKSWCTFRVASTPRVQDRQSNEWTDGTPLWLGCRAYGELADNIVASLAKGSRVIVQGRLTSREFTDKQGQQRTSLDLEIEAIGPELRWHVAQPVSARDRQQQGGGGAWGGQGAGWGNQPPQGQDAWGQPATQPQQPPAQQQGSPWNGGQQAPQQAQQPPQQQQQAQGNPWQGGQPNGPPQGQQGSFGNFDDEAPF